MASSDLPLKDLLVHLEEMAKAALTRWNLPPNAQVSLLNVAENVTYLVTADDGHKSVLRIHRENYHTRAAIECELAWVDALGREGGVTTPGYYIGTDGQAIQKISTEGLPTPRFAVLFHFVEGAAPDETGDQRDDFEKLGAIAARCHNHVLTWQKPDPFERLVWDVDAIFGASPTWGDWRHGPEVDEQIQGVLEQVEKTVRTRLARFGKSPVRYNLIHADMRLANLLVNGTSIRVIDFDDCGWGWFMYDFAAAISFMEDSPAIPALKAAWLRGYRSVRPLSPEDQAEIETFIMLRRMALLAWIGSHIEAPEPQALAKGFAAKTAELGQAYLKAISLKNPEWTGTFA